MAAGEICESQRKGKLLAAEDKPGTLENFDDSSEEALLAAEEKCESQRKEKLLAAEETLTHLFSHTCSPRCRIKHRYEFQCRGSVHSHLPCFPQPHVRALNEITPEFGMHSDDEPEEYIGYTINEYGEYIEVD